MTALVDRSAARSHDQTAKPYEGPGPDEITGSILGATLPESARISRESARMALESARITLESARMALESARMAVESASANPGARPVESASARTVSGGGPAMPGICATTAEGMKAAESITAVRAHGTANNAAVKSEIVVLAGAPTVVVAGAPTQNAPAW